jgi:hypothetical protein
MAFFGCGPVAISLILGVPAEDVCKALSYTGHDGRDGTNKDDLARVRRHFGYTLRLLAHHDGFAGPKVAAWLGQRPAGCLRDAPLLLMVATTERPDGAHWIAVKGSQVGDCLESYTQWQPGPGDIAGWHIREAHVVTPHVPSPEWRAMREDLDRMVGVYAPGLWPPPQRASSAAPGSRR